MQKVKQLAYTEWFRLKLMFQAGRKTTVLYVVVACLCSVIPVLSAWVWKILIDIFTQIYYTHLVYKEVWIYLSLFLGIQISFSLIITANNVLTQRINRASSYRLNQMVMEKMAEVDMEFYDNPANHDVLYAAQQSETYISGAITNIIFGISEIIALISGLALFLSYNLVVGLLFIITFLPGGFLAYKQKREFTSWTFQQVPFEREKNYFKFVLTGEYFAKEVRLYNLKNYFHRKYSDMWENIRAGRKKVFVRSLKGKLFAALLSYGGLAGVIVLSVKDVIAGVMTLGTLVLFVDLAKTIGEKMEYTFDAISFEVEFVHPQMSRFNQFIEYKNKICSGNQVDVGDCPEIEFRHVYFKYPGSENYVIEDVSFKLKSKEKIAIVGVNGAGKSTIIKLLLRFYQPEKGSILINNKDIQEYSLEALHRLFGVCFQDIIKYALTMKENITLSDVEQAENETELYKAIVAASLEKIVQEVPNGYDAMLTREFDDQGIELSGGQWQKIAIARTFFRNANILVLDEPSSALDPEAEEYIFSSFKEMSKNKSGIIISHRLSSIRMVDKILVLEQGTIVEQGTHKELMELDGRYALLYNMQAEKYKGGKQDA